MASRLEVPVGTAARFEQQLLRFSIAEDALLGHDATQKRKQLEEVSRQAAVASSPHSTAVIELPERFWDAAFGSAAAELDAARLSGPDATKAWRELRLEWLRVQESFVRAESENIVPRINAMQRRAQAGHGGGGALMRMLARHRQLEWKLLSLREEKVQVKRAPWLEHAIPSQVEIAEDEPHLPQSAVAAAP